VRLPVLVLLIAASPARADLAEQLFQRTNAGRHELGIGIAGGWRVFELHGGHHVTDRWTVIARGRFGEHARAGELDLSYVLGRGQVVLPTDVVLRVDLALAAGGGMTSRDGERAPVLFGSAAIRVQPRTINGLAVELGVRHDATTTIAVRLAVLFPFDQHECWVP